MVDGACCVFLFVVLFFLKRGITMAHICASWRHQLDSRLGHQVDFPPLCGRFWEHFLSLFLILRNYAIL